MPSNSGRCNDARTERGHRPDIAADRNAKPPSPPSSYRIVNDGWGSRSNFQLSYGLKLVSEDFDQGRAILDAFRHIDGEREVEDRSEAGRERRSMDRDDCQSRRYGDRFYYEGPLRERERDGDLPGHERGWYACRGDKCYDDSSSSARNHNERECDSGGTGRDAHARENCHDERSDSEDNGGDDCESDRYESGSCESEGEVESAGYESDDNDSNDYGSDQYEEE